MSSNKLSSVLDDASLLSMMQNGNKDAFNVLYEKYWEHAYCNAYKRLKDAEQAKDIVQEVFVSIWLKKDRPIINLPAYLNIAVRNQVFKLVEKQKVTTPFFDFLHDFSETHLSADAAVLWKEFHKAYELLLASLPPKRQEVFRLRFHEDLTTNEIADRMDISRKTVQNQLGKAIIQLRSSIAQLLTFLILLVI